MIEQISNATPNKILNLGLFGGKIVTFHRFSTPPYLSICPIQNVNSWFSYSDRLFMVSDGMYVYVVQFREYHLEIIDTNISLSFFIKLTQRLLLRN